MKILVIGCGSIGQRHIKNLLHLKAGRILAFDIDKKRMNDVRNISSSILVSDKLGNLWGQKPTVVFITVPTALHIRYSIQTPKRGCHLFIEKPLSNNLKNINTLIKATNKKKLITMVGCNIRFHRAIKRIKELLEKNIIGKVISARIKTGQYLPDWHPWEDYRKMYSAKKRLGGGIILDGIHEIDYAMWFFGNVEKVVSMYAKLSNLEIETEDIAEILLKFSNGPIVNVHMDYIHRSYSRSCEIIGEMGTIYWDYSERSVKLYLADIRKWRNFYEPKGYDTNQMYIDEIRYFLNCVQRRQNSFNNVSVALKTLKTALAAKRGFK